jgi:hypothetical protein
MQKTYNKDSNKKNLVYISVTSNKKKIEIINLINTAIDSVFKSTGVPISLIPPKYDQSGVMILETIPSVSFWHKEDEDKFYCGLTITLSSTKWGWQYDVLKKEWVPCKYMQNNSMENVLFNTEQTKLLLEHMMDHCSKYLNLINKIKKNY